MRIPFKLKGLVSKVPENSQFTKRHGYLLSLLTSGFEEDMMSVLFQFFDLEHHCFTFPDYQLVPVVPQNLPSNFSKDHPGPSGLLSSNFKP